MARETIAASASRKASTTEAIAKPGWEASGLASKPWTLRIVGIWRNSAEHERFMLRENLEAAESRGLVVDRRQHH